MICRLPLIANCPTIERSALPPSACMTRLGQAAPVFVIFFDRVSERVEWDVLLQVIVRNWYIVWLSSAITQVEMSHGIILFTCRRQQRRKQEDTGTDIRKANIHLWT